MSIGQHQWLAIASSSAEEVSYQAQRRGFGYGGISVFGFFIVALILTGGDRLPEKGTLVIFIIFHNAATGKKGHCICLYVCMYACMYINSVLIWTFIRKTRQSWRRNEILNSRRFLLQIHCQFGTMMILSRGRMYVYNINYVCMYDDTFTWQNEFVCMNCVWDIYIYNICMNILGQPK